MPMLEGKVIKVVNDIRIVINKGSENGVCMSDRFLIYRLGEELFDPETGESLGVLELVCGEGKPEHIQEKMTILISSRERTSKAKTVIKNSVFGPYGQTEEVYDPKTIIVPFDRVSNDCLFKQIK